MKKRNQMIRNDKSAYRFEDKVVVITGAAREMGAAHARAFHQEGAKVVLTDALEEGRQVAQELGDRAIFLPLDVTDADAWTSVVDTAEKEFGSLSVLVNNAAIITGFINIEDFEEDLWRNAQRDHLCLHTLRLVIQHGTEQRVPAGMTSTARPYEG